MTTDQPSETIRVLLIDDDPGDFQMTRAMIKQIDRPELKYEVEWSSSYEEALDALSRQEHDLYLVDYFLEDRDGLDLVREAREMGLQQPLIMLTGRGSREVDIQAMEAGASDYLVKGRIDPDILERSLRYAVERVRAEAARRESEEQYRNMFTHLPIGLYRVSPQGEFIDANPALMRILGFPDASTLQDHYAATLYVNESDVDRFRELIDEFGVARGFESVLDRHDGARTCVRITARAHRDARGTVQYIEGAVEDVTDERTASELLSSAARFEAVFSDSNLPLVLVDLEGRVLEANPAFLSGFSHDLEGIGMQRLADLVVEEERNLVESDVLDLASGDRPAVQSERTLLGGDGVAYRTRIRGSLVQDRAGEPDHLMFMMENTAQA